MHDFEIKLFHLFFKLDSHSVDALKKDLQFVMGFIF